MKHLPFFFALGVLLMSCGQNPSPNLEPIGAIELSINAQDKLTTAALLPNQNTPASSVDFTTDSLSVATDGSKKFLNAKFKVSNNSGAALDHLTLVAYVQTTNQAGTAIKDLQNFGGLTTPQLTAYAQSATPSHAMNVATPPTVNTANADMQIFSEAELINLTSDASSLLQGGEYLLPYAFVARAATGTSRSIPTGANAGFLTVGIQVPNTNEPTNGSPERFRMTFIAFTTPSASRVSESVEEQNTTTATTRKNDFSATDLLVLGGSNNISATKRECSVRTVGSAASPVAYLVDTLNTPTLTPAPSSHNNASTASIAITTDRAVTALDVSDIRVRGNMRGNYTGTWSGLGSSSLTFTPTQAFFPNETITVTLPTKNKWCQAKSWNFRGGNGASATATTISFGSRTTVSADLLVSSQQSAMGDFNNDGNIDMVMTARGSNLVYVYFGNGTGGFLTNRLSYNFTACANPNSVDVGDFNNDGRLDWVANCETGDSVRVYLNNGISSTPQNSDFSFTSYGSGDGPTSVKVGDLNNDNKPDVVVSNFNSVNLGVLLGNGDGTLQAVTYFAVDKGPQDVILGDFTNDGNLDMVAINSGAISDPGNTVSLFAGNGNGTFQAKVEFTSGSPIPPSLADPKGVSLAAGDFNADNRLDLAVSNSRNKTVSVLLGASTGTFSTKTDYTVVSSFGSLSRLQIADVNEDGKPDLVVLAQNYTSTSHAVLVFLGNGDGTFGTTASVIASISSNQQEFLNSFLLTDLNKDGKLDLLTNNSSSNSNNSVTFGIYLRQ